MSNSVWLPKTVALLACIALYTLPACAGQRYKPGQSFRDCARTCPEMIVVPPGSYLMGSESDDPDQAPKAIEQPRHRVTIRYEFAVGRYEVTRDEYARFALETHLRDPDGCHIHEPPNWPEKAGLNWHNTSYPQSGRDPVVCVSWPEAEAYTHWLSRKAGHSYRLLSEAEYEYVARAGTTTEAFWGDDVKHDCEYGNGVDLTLVERFPQRKWEHVLPCHDGHVFTAPVGSYKPNGFGLYDIQGNVAEWVADCTVQNYEGAPTDGSARTDGGCLKRMNRGGSWTSNPTGMRSADRGWDYPTTRAFDLGFRVARDL